MKDNADHVIWSTNVVESLGASRLARIKGDKTVNSIRMVDGNLLINFDRSAAYIDIKTGAVKWLGGI